MGDEKPKENPLKRSNTQTQKNLMNLDSEGAFFDLFHDLEEPQVIKRQCVDDANKFVNYKETDSQIAENQSHIDGELLEFPFNNWRFENKDSFNDDTHL